MPTEEVPIEKTTKMPSREQLALSFGNAVLALQETYHKKAGEYLEAVARHEYVEGLFDLAQNFRTAVQRKAEANGRGIENIPALVCELAWAERRDIGEDLIKLADHALEEVMTEANNQMYERYKKCKEERSKGFLSLFRGELHYGDMYDVGGWDSVEFRLFAHVAHKAREILNVRHLLRRA